MAVQNRIVKVQKRNRALVKFDDTRIRRAICHAAASIGGFAPLAKTYAYDPIPEVLTEEQQNNSFAEALAGRISKNCFQSLDAAVEVLGALNLPAVPMNMGLEKAMLPNAEKVTDVLIRILTS